MKQNKFKYNLTPRENIHQVFGYLKKYSQQSNLNKFTWHVSFLRILQKPETGKKLTFEVMDPTQE